MAQLTLPGSIFLVALVEEFGFNTTNEAELQDALENVFTRAELRFEREKRLTQRDRVDFYFPVLRIGLEVKVQGSLAAVTRQLHRYAQSPDVDGLVLVTNLHRLDKLPLEMNGKRVRVGLVSWL